MIGENQGAEGIEGGRNEDVITNKEVLPASQEEQEKEIESFVEEAVAFKQTIVRMNEALQKTFMELESLGMPVDEEMQKDMQEMQQSVEKMTEGEEEQKRRLREFITNYPAGERAALIEKIRSALRNLQDYIRQEQDALNAEILEHRIKGS